MVRVLLVTSVVTGVASQYDPGVFEGVVRVRQSGGSLPAVLPDYDGAHIAVLTCDDIGQQVLVCHEEDCRFALIADCAGIADGGHAWMVRNGVAGELDHKTSVRLRSLGRDIALFREVALAGVVPGRGLRSSLRR